MTQARDVRVLIVEDEALVSEFIRHALESAGYRVAGCAADGAEALEMAQASRPDVVIMEIDLPGMDGLEVARQIQAAAPLPVVVLTAHETPELVERAGAAGVAAYLTKPPDARELDRAISISLARFAELQALRREKAALEAASRPKVLWVNDDEMARQAYVFMLRRAGYDVIAVGSAEEALAQLVEWPADLIVWDTLVRGLSVLDLLGHLQEPRRDCELILIIGNADVETAVQALHAGAFDYLVRPVGKEKMLRTLARAGEAQRRRRKPWAANGSVPFTAPLEASASTDAPDGPFRIGSVVLDPGRRLITVNGQRVEATPTEIQLFMFLCRNADRVLTPQEMAREARGLVLENTEAAELIRPHINNLRRKLLAASAEADVIETVRSAGYRLKTTSGH